MRSESVAPFVIDIRQDRRGEYFDLLLNDSTTPFDVLNVDKTSRHLLLRAGTDRLLCGHDERHWFVGSSSR